MIKGTAGSFRISTDGTEWSEVGKFIDISPEHEWLSTTSKALIVPPKLSFKVSSKKIGRRAMQRLIHTLGSEHGMRRERRRARKRRNRK